MMPLKETNKNKKATSTDVSSALSTEEIVSLLSKSNKDFIKESEISSNITNLFKKVSPSILAKKLKLMIQIKINQRIKPKLKKVSPLQTMNLQKRLNKLSQNLKKSILKMKQKKWQMNMQKSIIIMVID